MKATNTVTNLQGTDRDEAVRKRTVVEALQKEIVTARADLIIAMDREGFESAPDNWSSEQFEATPGHVAVTATGEKAYNTSEMRQNVGIYWWFIPHTPDN
jgi:hypothetical protein